MALESSLVLVLLQPALWSVAFVLEYTRDCVTVKWRIEVLEDFYIG